ncbi:MAG: alpha-galactosidase, partial [Clostridia bacterium]|nr:alpha-galactosidase [Clostridia bacterium]
MKITFMGAGSTVFARNVIGDCMCVESLRDSVFALYDIDGQRLEESRVILEAMRKAKGGYGKIECYLGVENRKEALRGANFVVDAIQVGLYDPCTIIDFEVPKKYGLRQTIADTLGIGGIMRALRTIPVLEDFARDMEEVCPDALFLNYTNPMAMLSGYMQRYTGINTVGLCHSVQVCSESLLNEVDMQDKLEGRKELIAGINHMAWLLEIKDKEGNDLYPEIKARLEKMNYKLDDPECGNKVRLEYIRNFGYYVTESSEHNSEYNMFYIKSKYPELIEKYNIPLDEYPRRCVNQIEKWKTEYAELVENGVKEHERSNEYASRIMEAITESKPIQIGGNVLNTDHIITNLPAEACVEVPCLVNGYGINPCHVGPLP